MQEILNTVERLKALFNLARRKDHIALSKAIKGDTKSLHKETNKISKEVANLQIGERHKKILRWLSAPNSSSNYNEALKGRHANTGDCFLGGSVYADYQRLPSFESYGVKS